MRWDETAWTGTYQHSCRQFQWSPWSSDRFWVRNRLFQYRVKSYHVMSCHTISLHDVWLYVHIYMQAGTKIACLTCEAVQLRSRPVAFLPSSKCWCWLDFSVSSPSSCLSQSLCRINTLLQPSVGCGKCCQKMIEGFWGNLKTLWYCD